MNSLSVVTILFPSFRRVAVNYLWAARSEGQIGGLAALRLSVELPEKLPECQHLVGSSPPPSEAITAYLSAAGLTAFFFAA
jgi:hypothetical protein